jgi:hypothetical protein
MQLSKQQVNTILNNAPAGTDKTAILDGLIQRGYDLEGVDTAVAKQSIAVKNSSVPVNDGETKDSPSYIQRVAGDIGKDINTRIDKVGEILNRNDTGVIEKGVQLAGQGAGAVANAIEKPIAEIPGIKQTLGAIGSGIDWLSKSAPFKIVGDIIGDSKTLQEATTLYDTDQNFKDTVDGVANLARLGMDVEAVVKSASFSKNVTEKLATKAKSIVPDSKIIDTINNDVTSLKNKTISVVKNVAEGRDAKLLSIFSGESPDAVKKAIQFPKEADIGIKNGDAALREAVQTGAQSSIKAKQTFIQAYSDSFNKLVENNPNKIISRQKVLYQFADDLTSQGVKIKNGKLDFTTSKIVANPGEISKINTAYKAIQNWKDFTLEGTNKLKQLVGDLTKFANEAGGTSKSPFLGKYYYYLDSEIAKSLPKESKLAYQTMNKKFSSTIGLYDDMVDAFNSGDPFTKLANIFGSNKDTLRQVIDFYEKTTGNKISPIVAGRVLAEEKTAAFGFLNPRSWVDFFIPPKIQAGAVTSYGKFKQSLPVKKIK